MAPFSSGVIVITHFQSSGVMGICQMVPVTCQVIVTIILPQVTPPKRKVPDSCQLSFNFTLFLSGMYVFSGDCICKTLILELL